MLGHLLRLLANVRGRYPEAPLKDWLCEVAEGGPCRARWGIECNSPRSTHLQIMCCTRRKGN